MASSSSEIKTYPFLHGDEFAEACHHLERRYCHATLGPVRKRWKLRSCRALNTTLLRGPEYHTYIQIIRPLEHVAAAAADDDDDREMADMLDNVSLDAQPSCGQARAGMMTAQDREMMNAEEADKSVVPQVRSKPDVGYVTYEIHLHATYQGPVLWFSLHNLPADEPAFSIDTVFKRLVSDQYKDGLRTAGGIGGISADYHPVTGVPCFFVHPCLLGEAMSNFECTKETYLMVWLGLVGGTVGLWVPKEMAA